jgi:hypothetical protein
MRLKRHLLTITAAGGLAAAGLALAAPTHVLAGPANSASTVCDDHAGAIEGTEVTILDSPITLALEVGGSGNNLSGHAQLCWSTTPEGSSGPELSGGSIALDAPGFNAPGTDSVNCYPDPATPVAASCSFMTTPSVSANGSNLTVTLPFGICAGVGTCPTVSNPGPAPDATGVIVGSITQVPPPPGGQSAAYQLTSVCVTVDSVVVECASGPVAGATTGAAPSLFIADGGPCVNAICLPVTGNSTIGVSPAQEATIYLPGFAPIPLGTGRVCYQATSTSPACP